jgi:FixJ family two-component response regulator
VEDFSSAQSFLDSVPIDSKGCLILDLRMPGIDGFALQEKLNESYYNLHIIFITAYAQEGDREYALKGGAFGFLQKPFHDQSLLELINKAIEQDKNR